jgi:uncharacterized membrane protein
MLHERGALLTGIGIGAGLMYFLDPQRGRRRRALVRDKLAHSTHVGADAVETTRRDAMHRASGTVSRLRALVRRKAIDDLVLIERVRAQLGRVVSHPHAIKVEANDGVVTLSGPILRNELPALLRATERVRGVRDVVNALAEHSEGDNVPALQGGRTPAGIAPDIWQQHWAPATRVAVGSAGGALAAYGASRRGAAGALLAASGVGLLARAATNLDVRRLTGVGARRRAVDVRKTIIVNAPVEEVFAFWMAYENFPRFMSRVLNVRPTSRERQSHWTVTGPANVPVEFDAEISALAANQLLGWRTVKGSPVAHAGLIRFDPLDSGRTRLQIQMSYNPPGGWLGHGVASAFGVDPKSSLDTDLARLKTLIETGHPARDAAQPLTRE